MGETVMLATSKDEETKRPGLEGSTLYVDEGMQYVLCRSTEVSLNGGNTSRSLTLSIKGFELKVACILC